jgi:uncharacterized lipoprotein YmbA
MKQTRVLAALLVMAACSSVPETSYYLLTSSTPARAMDQGTARATPPLGAHGEVVLGLGRIEIADYLKQPGVILETAEYQIRPATYHRWGEPLPQGIRRALLENLTVALPGFRVVSLAESRQRPDLRLDLEVERFHGTEQGVVVFGGRWSLDGVDGTPKLTTEAFSYREEITSSGYHASVATQAKLLARLSEAIAARVAAVGREPG